MISYFQKTQALISRHSAHMTTMVFVIGFAIDFLTLPAVENSITIWIGIVYIALYASTIFIRMRIKIQEGNSLQSRLINRGLAYAPLVTAFFSGSLLSYVFVLYFRSASLSVSWPFFALLFATIIANELITHKKERFLFDLGLLYTSTTFILIYLIPYIAGVLNNTIFIVALALAAISTTTFGLLVERTTHKSLFKQKQFSLLGLAIPALIFILYIAQILPPIPVSLAASGVYQFIQKNSNGNYTFTEEKSATSWWQRPTHHFEAGKPMYFFSAIAAPARLRVPITHTWERYDETTGTWVQTSHIVFPIVGGRVGGYRGYSINQNTISGTWRVTVALDGNRVIEREYFKVVIEH